MKSGCRCGAQPPCPYDRPVIFTREGMFYPILGSRCEEWSRHAELNPGTLSIEDALTGERLWPEGTEQ